MTNENFDTFMKDKGLPGAVFLVFMLMMFKCCTTVTSCGSTKDSIESPFDSTITYASVIDTTGVWMHSNPDSVIALMDTIPEEVLAKWKEFENTISVKNDLIPHTDRFIRRFADVAIAEHKNYGIPASITLAQAILESRWGKSKLTKECNNFFGIKCFSKKCSKGHCKNFLDDSHKDFFRAYSTPWESFRAHSIFLERSNYEKCHECGNDYKCWAKTLRERGYATDPNYDKILVKLIHKHNLNVYDKL